MKQKISELTNLINQWNYEYFILNEPTVSDLEYDKALLELERLEKEFPQFIHPNSPTKKVGANYNAYLSKFTKVKHMQPMLSLDKAYSYDDVEKFISNIEQVVPTEEIQFSLEPKIDGLSIALHYQNGYLAKALTRGDGVEGEDVTDNVFQIKGIPHIIDYSNDIEVRGEVFMSKNQFNTLKTQMSQEGKKIPSNPRNAASGTLRQKDSEVVKQRSLSCYIYEIVEPLKHDLNTQKEILAFLKKINIPINPYMQIVDSEELPDKIEDFAEIKNKFNYDVDGLVIKLNNLKYWERLGKTAKFPKHSVAFKYDVEQASSIIKNIAVSVGRTGKVTYIADIDPVELNQTLVTRATLHNYNFIEELKINVGDEIAIIKAGEIIPKIIALTHKNTENTFKKVLSCPSCLSQLVEYEGIVDQFCTNQNCEEKQVNKIYHFASRKAMNIVGMGLELVRSLYRAKIIEKIEDLYSLETKIQELSNIKLKGNVNFGLLRAQKLLINIKKSKNVSFAKVLFALGLNHLGSRAAILIAQKYSSFADLINDRELDLLKNIDNIGPKTVNSILDYMSDENNVQLMKFLDINLNYINANATKSNIFAGKTFVITGTLSYAREHFVAIIEANGGNVSSSVSKKTSYLLAGEHAGSKLDKAKSLNIQILNENEFNNLLK
ncbi:NAD-dependent DNA ligase LigA [Mycoplasmopsis californica]|nr:NAD-dependent DNA ligase LigA [Mycoplasmopsis californica]